MVLFSGQNLNSLNDEVAGVTAVTIPRTLGIAETAFTSGTLYMTLISLPPGLTVNNLDFWMIGASTTPSHGWMVLTTPGGVILATTADNTGGQAANTYYRAAVTAPFVTPPGSPSVYYIGNMLAAATPGTFAGGPAVPITPAGVPTGTLAEFVTAGTGFTTPQAVGSQLTLISVAGATANIYAATA